MISRGGHNRNHQSNDDTGSVMLRMCESDNIEFENSWTCYAIDFEKLL